MTTPPLTPTPTPQPLAGITVLDLSRVLAGPWATQLLGDLGADVIKVERPGAGDDTRGWGPPFLEGTRESAYFLCANRNKRSIAIDLASPEGQAVVKDLAAKADVVIENFKLGGMAAYGLDYASLAAINPRLVYCSITGFGQDGPYAERPGYDFIVQGMGGLMSVTGEPDGAPGGGPMKAGVAVCDLMTGMYASSAILAALYGRQATGRGTYIDLALLDVQVAFMANAASNYLVSGEAPPRLGNAHPNIVPYQAFPTADGDIILAIGNDAQFRRFCTLAGRPELGTDPAYATNRDRVVNRVALLEQVRDLVARHTSAWWIEALEREGVPYGPVNTLDQVFADPQVVARGTSITLPHPTGAAGEVALVRNPIHADWVQHRKPPPLLGEDTDSVLNDVLGYSTERIEALRKAAVVA